MEKEKSYPLLLQWMRSQEIDDKMLWKKAAINQECFVRDVLTQGLLKVPVFVVSTHMSKSVRLPVYRFRIQNGIVVTMRENFYGWVVSLKNPFPVDLPEDLVGGDGAGHNEDITSCYCEGFKEDWVYPYGTKGVRLTTFRVEGDYRLYALMRELNMHPAEKNADDASCGEYIARICIEQQMKLTEGMRVSEVFYQSYFGAAYNYDFCQANGQDCYFHASSRDLTKEDELKEEIADFAHRICMSPENKKIFNNEMAGLQIGRREEERL